MRPLDRVPSIKLKLGIVIVAAVGVSAGVSTVGFRLGVPILLRPVISSVLALALVQVLARGMTSPLREMVAATRAMAEGDYERRVTASSADEVGELARAFNAMAAELSAVDRLRRDLIANVSHELRTPISALQATLENLVDGVIEPDPDALRTMLQQVERLGRLVSQLLDLSRLESGVVPIERRRFPVRELLDRVRREHDLHQPANPVVVDVAAGDLVIDGDEERLHQVLANLVDNAARHSPRGAPIRLVGTTDARGTAVLEVCDDGPGIPDAEAERVFERFYRADSARATVAGGAGLGLAIARWIVDLHGGDIRAETSATGGCRMVVELPAGRP